MDPIVLNDIDECKEWLVGQVDDDNDNDNEEGEMSRFFMMISLLIGLLKLHMLENQ